MLVLPLVMFGIWIISVGGEALEVDKKGYVLYCPCMGRFGNQADHFLGSLAFAKAVDRTLVLPPWVEYHFPAPKSVQVPFDTYFKVEPLRAYHRVLTMEEFMEKLAPTIWPEGNRAVFCFQARTYGEKQNDCNAKEGNPFGPFWDTFNIDFDLSEFYSPLYHDSSNLHDMERWKKKYSPEAWPVIAFTGAPAQFPVQQQNAGLQQYLEFSDNIASKRDEYIAEHFGDEKFLGIHLRLGSDFENACKHIKDSPLMFGAAQCLGYRMEHGKPSSEMCYPSEKTIARDVAKALKKSGIQFVYVATDSKDLIKNLSKKFKKVKFFKSSASNPHLDLAMLCAADKFIGNCISTFTAFVTRARGVHNKPSNFWDFPPMKHDEL
ncbi:OFUT1-like protein [Mya arenaria]|uniref:GDP-fucose protein O-fucosyltransferase 1 n=1 Tax=Mya arenaria TaxID=6604 RepID=A0ABY7FMS7_MYAAR|nr:GDP-fucose protein O-fucosyltransferase 1-like [Mya arenaria]XP_052771918.1 GDP-fucose protein O-fucosyltransferase 1-like [Mya arenaria]WAR22041.1 OFUT1-like protein [Mya arenaria]